MKISHAHTQSPQKRTTIHATPNRELREARQKLGCGLCVCLGVCVQERREANASSSSQIPQSVD